MPLPHFNIKLFTLNINDHQIYQIYLQIYAYRNGIVHKKII
jgi:hypothetical protein